MKTVTNTDVAIVLFLQQALEAVFGEGTLQHLDYRYRDSLNGPYKLFNAKFKAAFSKTFSLDFEAEFKLGPDNERLLNVNNEVILREVNTRNSVELFWHKWSTDPASFYAPTSNDFLKKLEFRKK